MRSSQNLMNGKLYDWKTHSLLKDQPADSIQPQNPTNNICNTYESYIYSNLYTHFTFTKTERHATWKRSKELGRPT